MRTSRLFPLLIVLWPLTAAAATDQERFELWNECRPLAFLVVTNEAIRGTPLHDSISELTRSRLRAARIFRGDDGLEPADWLAHAYLESHVTASDGVFLVRVVLRKYVQVMSSKNGEYWPAVTWDAARFGVYGTADAYVVTAFSMLMDKFVDHYLRINELACLLNAR